MENTNTTTTTNEEVTTPVDETTVDTTTDTSVEETPVEEAPVEETPSEAPAVETTADVLANNQPSNVELDNEAPVSQDVAVEAKPDVMVGAPTNDAQ